MARITNFDKTMFYRLGAMKFSEEYPTLAKLTDVCTYDATLYDSTRPKQCMIRESTSFRPHLVRHLNLLEDDMRDYIQDMWNRGNAYIKNLNVTQYQCFLVITNNKFSVGKHTHGDHMGDTITVVSVLGEDTTNSFLCIGNHTRVKYPELNSGLHAICFDSDAVHYTETFDNNYYFHFVYDLNERVHFVKNKWTTI